jgi:glutathione synthase/RimK-type ligase-like ATP-grasp enzyme
MQNIDVVILTDARYVEPSHPGEYVRNILFEDHIVQKALEESGLQVQRKDWADPEFDWSTTRSVIFRSTWDYFDRFEEFKSWLNFVAQKTHLINSHELVKWNIDKHYLADLVRNNIAVVPTRFIESGSNLSLQYLHEITGWTDTVIKPTVGGAGRHTYRIDAHNLNIIAQKLESVMQEESFMLQPFQHSIIDSGERSLVFFGLNYSHSVLKKAREGDFRVQDDFGGSVLPYEPGKKEIQFARSAIQACPEIPLYSRVDIITANNGKYAISELELIEPELWFRIKPEAAQMLAKEIVKKLG